MRQVWYVASDYDTLFDTKLTAEKFARLLFPNEHPDKRYARIGFREVFSEGDLASLTEGKV